MPRTLIVSNRLPTKAQRTEAGVSFTPSEGGLATGLGSIYKANDGQWIGWPGLYLDSEAEEAQVTEELRADSMTPVFLTETEIKEFYEGFSNETLWPTFHYFAQYAVYDQQYWESYVAVNEKFCRAVLAVAHPDDTIWVHDYQLLLLPQLLRKALPEASIGFFLHIPFPSQEILRVLPWRTQLLEGMLGADLIGFHTFGYMRHFLSSVHQLLGFANQNGLIDAGSRSVQVDAFPMGIDYDKYAQLATTPETKAVLETYRQALQTPHVILSIDRLDYTKGIAERLRAFELLLKRYPELCEQVCLLMVVVPSRDQVEKYKELKEEIDELVGRINGTYRTLTWNPIQYFYRSFSLEELSAMYCVADVALVTPMRDGMNLVAKEFVASQTQQRGVLILSERAGAARELSDALIINPTDTSQLADTMREALAMPEEEQIQRMSAMQELVQRYNVHHWVQLFMDRLQYIKLKQQTLATFELDEAARSALVQGYGQAGKRLLFLDYDGTLVGFNRAPQRARPDQELLQLLTDLAADERNRVVVISGRDRQTLAQWLGHLPIDLICEHGAWLRPRGEEWTTIQPLNSLWKREIRPLLELHVDRTAGAFIEEKEFSLAWHYRRVDADLGELRSRELSNHLHFLASNTDLQVLEGNKVVEVKNAGVHKGAATARWVDTYPADFILALGDDRTDEDIFRALPDSAYTIKVGQTVRSLARYHVTDWQAVRVLLRELADSAAGQ
ncbi:bifunctional alpha,alpha-trehalose-phosphate synthase (UDP-forming)/trehalose-phosphatase [Hymenobacter sp. BT175]|uniref:bifunctional alpha,alpha-trehalose-phosphate synthase (UDP-forming)/trehalose-phosphatase n=1 Tax=Hymenobacter translucens TaxID=2886507 RepID=UPI001D0F060F|nr:bifunctional alpha,alpha-trehalose-phosphate synthase (UDP-forming)/trehalose-phosphatase [Hymenobacter translucens]MCC2546400.1 bifunctional alpha,alpha-trehalose-phosphate synthase (UDP-forming)/trehalose-phosphatase [Hymenobacter translucens]